MKDIDSPGVLAVKQISKKKTIIQVLTHWKPLAKEIMISFKASKIAMNLNELFFYRILE